MKSHVHLSGEAPHSSSPAAPHQAASGAAVDTPTKSRWRGPACILVVDDDAAVRDSLMQLLAAEGYSVAGAADGVAALQIAETRSIDLMLLDLNMPRKSGWETLEAFSQKHPMIPIIIATARANQLFSALSSGAGALFEKPLEIPVLLAEVEKLLHESAQHRLARASGRSTDFHYQPAQPPASGSGE